MASNAAVILALPHRLKAERLRQGLSLQDVGNRMGKTKQEVARLEEPGNTPNSMTLAAAVTALGGTIVISFGDGGGE